MSDHVSAKMIELVLGELNHAETAKAERHLVECAACRQEWAVVTENLASLAFALEPVEPSTGARARLMAATQPAAQAGGRFAQFVEKVAKHLDLGLDKAAELLDGLAESTAWKPAPFPGGVGIEYITPPMGASLVGATVALLRLQPGARFPMHSHGGAERVLVLQGGFRDEQDGREFHPGYVQAMEAGSAHSFVGLPGEPCICIGVLLSELQLLEG